MAMPLDGASVVVTGGAMGLGRYIALGCAERGANVAICDIEEQALEDTKAELQKFGHQVMATRTDVRQDSEMKSLFESVASNFGSVDYLVNNAAIVPHFSWGMPHWPPVRDMEFDFWERIIATNVHGVFLGTKYALMHMTNQRSGHIVNVYGGNTSGTPGALTYVVTKEAQVAFTQRVAEEVREFNVCVMSMGPGAAIANERAPEEAQKRMPGPNSSGDRYFLAADAGMDLSGHLVDFVDDKLIAIR